MLNKIILVLVTWFVVQQSMAQCELIERVKDKFTDVESVKTPLSIKSRGLPKPGKNVYWTKNGQLACPVSVAKFDTGYVATFILDGRQSSSVSRSGAYILFTDGSKIQKPSAIVHSNYFGTDDEAMITATPLTDVEFSMLATKTIQAVKVGVTESDISPAFGTKLQDLFRCLANIDTQTAR